MNSVPVLEVRREVVVYEVVVALVVRDEGVVEVSGGIVTLGLLSFPTRSHNTSPCFAIIITLHIYYLLSRAIFHLAILY